MFILSAALTYVGLLVSREDRLKLIRYWDAANFSSRYQALRHSRHPGRNCVALNLLKNPHTLLGL